MGERGFYRLSDSKLQITTASELSNLFIQALSVIIPKETTKPKTLCRQFLDVMTNVFPTVYF